MGAVNVQEAPQAGAEKKVEKKCFSEVAVAHCFEWGLPPVHCDFFLQIFTCNAALQAKANA